MCVRLPACCLIRFLSLPAFLGLCLFFSAGHALAAETPSSRDGTRGLVALTEAAPGEALTTRVALGVDYLRRSSLIYPDDGASQMRRFALLSFAPLDALEFAFQYRMLDTHSLYVNPHDIRVRGDTRFSVKYGFEVDEVTLGGLVQANHYVGTSGFTPEMYLLGGYRFGDWQAHVQVGWLGHQWVDVRDRQSPVETMAWQKPTRNAVATRLALTYDAPDFRPFLEYSGEHHFSGGTSFWGSPHRLTPGAQIPVGDVGLWFTPSVDVSLGTTGTNSFPTEPRWRAGLMMAYEVPVRAIYQRLFPPPGVYAGVVTDAATGRPVADVQLWLDGEPVPMQSSARFRYEGRTGEFPVRVEAPGYLPHEETVRIRSEEVTMVSHGLTRNAGTLRGTVYLRDKVGEAFIAVDGLDERRLRSDAERGTFSVDLEPGSYAMTVTAPGYQDEERSFVVRLGRTVNFNRIELRPQPRPRPMVGTPVVEEAPTPVTEPVAATPDPVPATPAPAPEPVPEPVAVQPPAPTPAPEPDPVPVPVAPTPIPPAPVVEAPAPAVPKPPAPMVPMVPPEEELPDRFDSPVFFSLASSELDPSIRPLLEELADRILSDPTIARVIIEGRTDTTGPVEVNLPLAAARADAVVEFLRSRGVSKDRLATTATVYTRPAVGQVDEQRAYDRRVGFRVERVP